MHVVILKYELHLMEKYFYFLKYILKSSTHLAYAPFYL